MKSYSVELKENYPFLMGGTLSCLLMSQPWDVVQAWKRPALIVVPGGGYSYASKREGEPVAAEFFARGFQTFILNYVSAPEGGHYPEQLLEVAAAVDYVKKHAAEMNVNADEVFVIGFSAGGHITGNLAIEYASVSQKVGCEIDCKPTAVGLCYPVISQKHGHQGSYNNLLEGYTDEAKAELLKTLNLDEAVSENTPPAFLWATAEDACVPADNALRYAAALDKHGISYELHIYPKGSHGLSTCTLEINGQSDALARARAWVDDCANFFRMFVAEPF